MSIRGYARGPCPAFCLVFACLLFSELHLLAADLGNGAASPGGVCLESGECTSKGKFTYLIGSGWHASVSGFHPLSKINTRVDATVRTPSWFPLWYSHLLHFTSPVQVVVADSDSPVKPQHVGSEEQSRHYPLLQWVQLTQNFGHEAISVSPTVGGWERSVLQGAFQAILNDVDYYVYVEQDVLVRGEGWVEHCISNLRSGKNRISYGAATVPASTVGFGAQPLQQSLVVVSKAYLPVFVRKLLQSKSDIESAPIGTSRLSAESRWHANFGSDVDLLPFGTGRTRPIPDGRFAYAQQMSREEISTFLKNSGLSALQTHSPAGEVINDGVPEVTIALNLGAGQAAYKVPAGLHEEAFAQMLCLQVMQNQLKKPKLRWNDVKDAPQMVACVSGVSGLARNQRDQQLRKTPADSSAHEGSVIKKSFWSQLYATSPMSYDEKMSISCSPDSGSCACTAAWLGGQTGVIPKNSGGTSRPHALSECFEPNPHNMTRLVVEGGSWVADELIMGRYSCPQSTCMVSSSQKKKDIDEADVYLGVSRRNQPPTWPPGSGAASSSQQRKPPLTVVLNLENPKQADTHALCQHADIAVGYRNFCPQVKFQHNYIAASYLSDPVEAFRLPPLNLAKKQIAVFSMVKNCGANARNTRMQSVVRALATAGVQVNHFGRCTFGQPQTEAVSDAAERIRRGVCAPHAGQFIDPNHNPEKDCLLHHSRFYLAFENSQDFAYMTEKLWGALKMGSIPIVWGDSPERVRHFLPAPEAAIFADDFESDAELAEYIAKVDTNTTLYNYHLAWKTNQQPFQPQFEALIAQGLEHMFCRICDFVVRKQGSTHEEL